VLSQILDATVYVAPDVIGIVRLHVKRGFGAARQDAMSEAGRKTLNLSFDAIRHIQA
jgi:hypothetical protein